MFEAFSHFMMLEHLGGKAFDPPNGPIGYFRQIDPDRQPFPTRDGYISIVPYTDEAWPAVFEVLGNPEFLDDEKFATRKTRSVNLSLLYREMARLTPQFTTAELLAKCHGAQIPAQAVRDLGDIMEDPHLAATGFFSRQRHPSEGAYFAMKHPVKFGMPLVSVGRSAPLLGEQTDVILNRIKRKKRPA